MIADTRSVATCNIAIRQILSYRPMSIRDRSIIKITTQNNTLLFMLPDVFCYSLSLGCPFLCCLGKFHNQQLGSFFCSINLQFSDNQILELPPVPLNLSRLFPDDY